MKVYLLEAAGATLDKMLLWLSENALVKVVAVFEKPDELLERIEREKPDLVFIRLGNAEIPGLKTGSIVMAIEQNIKVVFVSDEHDYALNAYEIGAYGYLLCPVAKDKFDKLVCHKQ
ncbi:MAG: response regulator [Desulfotomaculaceae bacterium]